MTEEKIFITKNKKGVTLLELLVALVITVLLGSAIFNVLKMAVDSWQKGEFATQKYQNARTALEKMGEIRSALKYSSADPYEAEFSGASNKVDFLANIHSPVYFYDPNKETESDLCEIGYFVSGTTLYRRRDTTPYPADSDVNTTSPLADPEGVASHITNLSLTYYSANGSSQTSWDSSTISSIPTRVKIEVTVRSDNPRYDDSEKVSTIVYLPASKQ